ncbi:uncharacterized protein EV154DRAFT_552131 [Mucor mucedo]|uniref:uncharacterized protein n=1 Tax=Mucor mucedo TaxID=29922 RepID=UPI00222055B1|nr:uncharacterized protein EV154DRAFT_552131 [Mucor mucedo]KAI7890567.1 hypothetical protein EV154DRAFT_552131 [Mucor mucedo]
MSKAVKHFVHLNFSVYLWISLFAGQRSCKLTDYGAFFPFLVRDRLFGSDKFLFLFDNSLSGQRSSMRDPRLVLSEGQVLFCSDNSCYCSTIPYQANVRANSLIAGSSLLATSYPFDNSLSGQRSLGVTV